LHAGSVIGHAKHHDQLVQAVQTRTDIGKAIGILMARYDLSEDRAFEFLVRVSQDSNTKIRNLARQIIEMTAADSGF